MLESVESFNAEKYLEDKKFIACFINEEFLRNEILIEAVKAIDKEIRELDRLITKSIRLHIDPLYLHAIRTRKFELRNNFSKILKRLREYLILDIRESEFHRNPPNIISEISNITSNLVSVKKLKSIVR